MAIPVNIDDLINAKTVESSRIEFKKGWNPLDVLRTVCAFANDIEELGGGYIVIGIAEKDGSPILPPEGLDQKELDVIQRDFFKLCKDNITPNIFPAIEIVEFHSKFIIIIWVSTGELRPYFSSVNLGRNSKMVMHVRHGSITKVADNYQEKQLRQISQFTHFDNRVNKEANIDNLDLGLIQAYLQEIKSNLYNESLKISLEELASKMQIARGPIEDIKPLNVGLLMFSKNPEKFFEGCKTNLIEFEDETGVSYTEKSFVGPIHIQIREILSYLKSNVVKQYSVKSPSRSEIDTFFNYPYQALEEAVVNSLYHRCYEEKRPNEIRIYNNIKPNKDQALDSRRIEIRSYPGPLPPIDSQMLSQRSFTSRNYRNIKLGDWLKNIHLAEKYATGVPTIHQSLEENGSPKPQFWTDDVKSEFLVIFRVHENTPQQTEVNVNISEYSMISNTQLQILELLVAEPYTHKKIKKKFSIDITNDLIFLLSKGYINEKRNFPTKILFILEKGREALKYSF